MHYLDSLTPGDVCNYQNVQDQLFSYYRMVILTTPVHELMHSHYRSKNEL